MSLSFRMLEQPGRQIQASVEKHKRRIAMARAIAARQVSGNIKKDGMVDIRASGNFGTRWTNAWTARLTPDGFDTPIEQSIVIETFFDGNKFQGARGTNYAHIFEFGGTITANNPSGLLWIPLSFADVPIGQRGPVWPSEYPGGLFRVNRKDGKVPLLLSLDDKQPKYFGIPQVVEPKKFHLRDVGTAAARQFQSFYSSRMKVLI